MPDPAQPDTRTSETGQDEATPATTAASLETVPGGEPGRAHHVRSIEPVIELLGLA